MTENRCSIIPGLRYRDAEAAVDFLCDAFGFTRLLVVPGELPGQVAHAQLTLGNGMIMLGSVSDDKYGKLVMQPEQAGGVTQAAYIVCDDIDAHYEQARAAGAEIVMELEAQPYGGKNYAARDPEGHLWNFGSYDPWKELRLG